MCGSAHPGFAVFPLVSASSSGSRDLATTIRKAHARLLVAQKSRMRMDDPALTVSAVSLIEAGNEDNSTRLDHVADGDANLRVGIKRLVTSVRTAWHGQQMRFE